MTQEPVIMIDCSICEGTGEEIGTDYPCAECKGAKRVPKGSVAFSVVDDEGNETTKWV